MSPTDLVTYNGIQMRRDDAQSLEDAQHLTVYVAGETSAARLPFRTETYPYGHPGRRALPMLFGGSRPTSRGQSRLIGEAV
jgi:hypothetical protein